MTLPALPSGCRIIDLAVRGDERGSLIALEPGKEVPFDIRRAYYIFGTRAGVSRGFHAHRRLSQLLVAVAGGCRLVIDNGEDRTEVALDRPDRGLLISGLVWREMHDFSPDCVLMVMADQPYDPSDYIRSYDDFTAALATQPA
nr:FdtA/QdtA family cupin domain-containing protein [uncultured Sphingomonas sp.]